MQKPVILVTGANGQLGKELRDAADAFHDFRFVFLSREDLPIHHFELMSNFYEAYKPSYLINCAAYTAVDKAESEKDLAFLVNGTAPGVLATVGKKYGTKSIHISTDYVFPGDSSSPYKESDPTGPVNVYGQSKLMGEIESMKADPTCMIIRTAWVYSSYGHNFLKTMLRLMKERPSVNVVNDQIGAPTYAADLAQTILRIIQSGKWEPGIYHYSNTGKISWFEFAREIAAAIQSPCVVNPIPGSQYPTPAKRPSFSLLDTSKIRTTYNIEIPDWKDGLTRCLHKLEA